MAAENPSATNEKGFTPLVTFHYFEVLGRGDPLTQIFEYHGQPFVKETYTKPEWGALKEQGKCGEFGGGLPQAKFTDSDGKTHEMGQLGAILRSFGIRFGYYDPKDWNKAIMIDKLVDTWADVIGAAAGVS